MPTEYAILSFVGCSLSFLSSMFPPHFPPQRQQQNIRPTMGMIIAAESAKEAITIRGTSQSITCKDKIKLIKLTTKFFFLKTLVYFFKPTQVTHAVGPRHVIINTYIYRQDNLCLRISKQRLALSNVFLQNKIDNLGEEAEFTLFRIKLTECPQQGFQSHHQNSNFKFSLPPRFSPLGTFRKEEHLQLSNRNSILMT